MLVWLQGQLAISRGLFECSQWEGERLGTLSPLQSDFCQNTNGDHAIGRNYYFFFLKGYGFCFFSLELKTPCASNFWESCLLSCGREANGYFHDSSF